MIDGTLKNISELFLYQASKDLERKLFYEAANIILLVVTDFDDGQDVTMFISQRLQDLSPSEIHLFIGRLRKEIEWLKSKVLKTEPQYEKINCFAEELSKLVLSPRTMKMGRTFRGMARKGQDITQEGLVLFHLSSTKRNSHVQIGLYSKRKKMKNAIIDGTALRTPRDRLSYYRRTLRRHRRHIMSKRRVGRASVLKRYRINRGE
jgi:hypothetical protein